MSLMAPDLALAAEPKPGGVLKARSPPIRRLRSGARPERHVACGDRGRSIRR